MAAKPHQRRLAGGGRKPLSKYMENVIYVLFVGKQLRKVKVTRAWIADQALAYHAPLHAEGEAPSPFEASQHWVSNFMARYSFSLPSRTNLTTLSDEALFDRAVSYIRCLRDLTPKMDKDHKVLMDETAVYFEDARVQTVDFCGARLVVVCSTGYASMRITAILAVTASGRKLPPVLIWKGKDKPSFEKIYGVYATYQKHSWVDSALLKRWFDLQFPQVAISEGKFLGWNSTGTHIMRKIKAKCQSRGIELWVIPGGLTPYLQAGDIAIYRSFKGILRTEINAWEESGD
ncbi:Pogo transposable element with KRAB, partial [Phytophthora palmivora]